MTIHITIERHDGSWLAYTVTATATNPVRACESALKMALVAHPTAREVSANLA